MAQLFPDKPLVQGGSRQAGERTRAPDELLPPGQVQYAGHSQAFISRSPVPEGNALVLSGNTRLL
jgi:hypothetical protein